MRQRSNKSQHSKADGQNKKRCSVTSENNDNEVSASTTGTLSSRCRRCLRAVKYVVVIMLIPPFLNYASLNHESKELQPPGNLYDIGFGQKLYLNCQGEGKPTVILDAPTGMTSDVWALVQPELAKHTKVCVYDRAGLGFSERAPVNYTNDHVDSQDEDDKEKHEGQDEDDKEKHEGKESTVESMVDNLYRLVSYSSRQDKPFIFVGAELGAMIGRFFAQIYEQDISDLVLIDPIVEDLFDHDQGIWANLWFRHLLPYFQAHQVSAAVGISRLALIVGLMTPPLSVPAMATDVIMRQKHLLCNPRHLSSVVDEYHFINESLSQMKTAFRMKSFPSNVSVTVLNGNYFDEQLPSALNKAWAKSQQTLLTQLHPNSKHIVVNGGDHHMMYRHPETVIEPIKRLIRQWHKRYRNTAQE